MKFSPFLLHLLAGCLAVGFVPLRGAEGPSWDNVAPVTEGSIPEAATAAPPLRAVRTWSDAKTLWILVEGASPAVSSKEVEVGGEVHHFSDAQSRWFLAFDGEQIDQRPWQITFQDGVPVCSQAEVVCHYLPERQAVEVQVPLSILGVGPVSLAVTSQTLFFIQEGMVGHEASRRLPLRGSIALKIPALPMLAGNPVVETASFAPEPGCIGATIEADRKVGYDLLVHDTSGQLAGEARNTYPARRQRAYVVGLPPGQYEADLSLTDKAGRATHVSSGTLDVPSLDTIKRDGFLQVRGKYVVNDLGQPVRLVGMARCQYHAEYEEATFGDLDAEFAHYRTLGINCIRLAVSPTRAEQPKVDLYETLGPERFVDEVVAPEVAAAIAAGLYVVIDDHHIKTTIAERDRWIPFWEAVARRYRDEPRVVMYELWNEPNLDPTGLSPESAPAIRDWYHRCIAAIRQIDTRHILLVSDWNAGWGAATESMWADDGFLIDEPYHQVAFSKHMAKDHENEAFLSQNLDRVSDQWGVPLVIGELELEKGLQTADDLTRLLGLLEADPRGYSVWLWRPHDDKTIFADLWSPWACRYARPSTMASEASQTSVTP